MLNDKALEAAKAVFHKTYVEKNGPLKAAIAAYLAASLQPTNPEQMTNASDGFSQYRRKQIAELRPWVSGDDMSRVSVSVPDKEAGSPKTGDMIARNPKNHDDQWLVAAAYFADNFEPFTTANPAQVTDAMVDAGHNGLEEWRRLYVSKHEVRAILTAAIGAGGQAVAEPRKGFPILGSGGQTIDWQFVADHGKQAQANHYQSVERLAARGGLAWTELYAVLHNKKWQKMDENDAITACRALETRYLSALSQPHPADERVASTKPAERGARQLYEYWSKQAGQNDLAMRLKELADIEEMLDEGQGDDDGAQTMPDFEPGWSVLAKVEACLFLLEKRRDVIEAYGDERLFDANAYMADGEIKMTAAEEVLAHLLINVIGVVDDQNYTPNEAQKIIEHRLSHPADERVVEALRKIEYCLTKDSLCEAEKIDDALMSVRRLIAAKEGR